MTLETTGHYVLNVSLKIEPSRLLISISYAYTFFLFSCVVHRHRRHRFFFNNKVL